MSGTLKLSSILSLHSEDFKVLSDNKDFFKYDEEYFNWSSRVNDCHLAIHRLLMLKADGYLPKDEDIAIERGVTDMVFHVPFRKIEGLRSFYDMDIEGLVKLELDTIKSKSGCESVNKILMIMKDEEFIKSKVISDRFRRAVYPDVETYLKCQEEYIDFTKKWNCINWTIEIKNAKDYIENVLNQKYE